MKMRLQVLNFFLLISCYLIVDRTVGAKNPGRYLACTGRTLKYETFQINYYFTSRDKRDQRFTLNATFGPDGIDFDPRRRTTLIVHGFMASGQDAIVQNLRARFPKWANTNVVVVSWERGHPNGLLYDQAVVNTEFAARQIRSLFKLLMKYFANTEKSVENWGPLHFVGHSLGAHVAGQAAHLLRKKNNLIVDRITGLDPADPCFEDPNSPLRLSKSHAKFVDVIHSDAAKMKNDGFGIYEPIGHVDFYLNGGVRQPGCAPPRRTDRAYQQLNVVQLLAHSLNQGACHHGRAAAVFYNSLVQASTNGCRFWAHPWRLGSSPKKILQTKCDPTTNCAEAGINAQFYDYTTTSVYYVATTGAKPYCNL